jgi:threonine dehydrogenase-like Zn-dependent dehydrogenase
MKALVYDGCLKISEIEKPAPAEGQALVKILYSSICNTDLEIIKGYMGFKGVLGHEFAGEVVSEASRLFGKKVVGEINCACGKCQMCRLNEPKHCFGRGVVGIYNYQGVFADYIALPEKNLHVIPEGVELKNAVFTEPLAAAYEIFESAAIKPSGKVFIFGAGKLGHLISQVFKLYGCDYTVFSRGSEKVDFARAGSLNARRLGELGPDEKAAVCVDCTGSETGIETAMDHLLPRGTLVLKTTVAEPKKIDLNRIVINEYRVIGSRCGPFGPALRTLAQGSFSPEYLIAKIFEFNDIIKAFEYASAPGSFKVLIKHF